MGVREIQGDPGSNGSRFQTLDAGHHATTIGQQAKGTAAPLGTDQGSQPCLGFEIPDSDRAHPGGHP